MRFVTIPFSSLVLRDQVAILKRDHQTCQGCDLLWKVILLKSHDP